MPNGHVHAATSACLAIGVIVTAFESHQLGPPAYALAGGCLAGIILTPDLDVDEGCESMAFIRDTLGIIPAWIWSILWKPYALLISHRSWLSHGPIVSTLIRVAYVVAVPAACWLVMRHYYPLPVLDITIGWWAPYILLGLMISDLAHITMDVINTAIKHLLHRFFGITNRAR